jgi:hypothetical protein
MLNHLKDYKKLLSEWITRVNVVAEQKTIGSND